MTTAMLSLLTFHDDRHVDDKKRARHHELNDIVPDAKVVFNRAIPAAQSLNPNHDNFMVFSEPGGDCKGKNQANVGNNVRGAFQTMWGYANIRPDCSRVGSPEPAITESDFADWRPVTFKRMNRETPCTSISWVHCERLRSLPYEYPG